MISCNLSMPSYEDFHVVRVTLEGFILICERDKYISLSKTIIFPNLHFFFWFVCSPDAI